MRKILLLAGIVFTTAVNAQDEYAELLFSDSFNYPIGTFATDMTGNVPGQGGWGTWIAAGSGNGALSNFQILANAGTQQNVLSVLGSDNNSGNKMAIQDFSSLWSNRLEGDFAQVEFKLFLPSSIPANSQNAARLLIYNAAGTSIIGGVNVTTGTGEVRFLAYAMSSSGTPGNLIYTFNEPFYVPKDKWVKLGLNWDYSSGQVVVLWDLEDGEGTAGSTADGLLAGDNIGDLYMGVAPRSLSTDNNTVASTAVFDDVKFFSTDDVYNLGFLETLSVKDIKSNSTFSVFPNPTADFLNISTKAKVDNVQVYDLSGKMVKATLSNNQVDVRNLAKGSYVVKIQTAEGSSTQKFIKK